MLFCGSSDLPHLGCLGTGSIVICTAAEPALACVDCLVVKEEEGKGGGGGGG